VVIEDARKKKDESADDGPPSLAVEFGPMHGGFQLGAPSGMTTNTDGAIHIDCAGFGDPCTTPAPQDFENAPAQWLAGTGWMAKASPVLAMSLGMDRFEVQGDPAFLILRYNSQWLAVLFTANKDEIPEEDVAEPETPTDIKTAWWDNTLDGSVFSYKIPEEESDTIPPQEWPMRALGPEDLGLDGAKIQGFNMHMALYRTDLWGPGSSYFPSEKPTCTPTIFFVLSPEFLDSAEESEPTVYARVGEWFGGDVPNSHTILRSTSTPGTPWTWSTPQVFLKGEDLKIVIGSVPATIDGLAMYVPDLANLEARDAKILFSTREAIESDQVRYVEATGGSSVPNPRRVHVATLGGGSAPLGSRLGGHRGLGDFCTHDPGSFVNPVQHWFDDYLTARRVPLDQPKNPLEVSGFRQLVRGEPAMVTCMSWRRKERAFGTAKVEWRIQAPFRPDVGVGGGVWTDFHKFTYTGEPLSWPISLGIPYGEFADERAMIAQWTLWVRGKEYKSKYVTLRF
jgi:hypothetical protein